MRTIQAIGYWDLKIRCCRLWDTRIGDSDGQQFLQYLRDNLNGVIACLIDDWVFNEQLTAGERSCLPNIWVVIFDIINHDISDEFIEYIPLTSALVTIPYTCEIKSSQSIQCQSDKLAVFSIRWLLKSGGWQEITVHPFWTTWCSEILAT